MKYLIVLIFISNGQLILSAQNQIEYNIPPNCKKLNDSLFIDKTEIRNIDWIEFLTNIKRDSSISFHIESIPDTLVWANFDPSGKKSHSYLISPSHRYYPVVGVSYEQAKNYCKWRSDYVNKYFSNQTKRILRFRLPTEAEWEFAATGGLQIESYPFGHQEFRQRPLLSNNPEKYFSYIKDTSKINLEAFKKIFKNFFRAKQESIFNVLHPIYGNLLYGGREPLSTVNRTNNIGQIKDYNKSMKPNRFGLTDMIGNVAEMVLEEGIAKGGSWAHTLEQSKIKNRQYYSKPEAWLGFRCVCEVKKVN